MALPSTAIIHRSAFIVGHFFAPPRGRAAAYLTGTSSMTVTSGLAKKRTRGALPPSMPTPRVT
jgi:hypothetical protein